MPSANRTMSFLDIWTITSNPFCGGWGPHTARVLVSDRAADVVLEPSQKGHDCSIAQRAAMWVGAGGGTPAPNNTDRKLPKKKGKQLFLVKTRVLECRWGVSAWRTPIGRFSPGGLVARAHRPILAGGLGGARPSADSGRGASCVARAQFWPGGLAGWRAPIGRFWPGGLAAWRTAIGQFWPGGWAARADRPILAGGQGGACPSTDSGRGAGWRAPIGRFWPWGLVARAHRPILAGGVGCAAPIGRFWPGG